MSIPRGKLNELVHFDRFIMASLAWRESIRTFHEPKSLRNKLVLPCRGCGGVPLTTPKIFCQADTSDLYHAITEIRSMFPEAPIFAIGFSLGGYTLNKYLGQVDTAVYGPGELLVAPFSWTCTVGNF